MGSASKIQPSSLCSNHFFFFIEAVRKYIEVYILGYSQYDLKNITSVRKAIATYEPKGLSWNEEIFAEETKAELLHSAFLSTKKTEQCSVFEIL